MALGPVSIRRMARNRILGCLLDLDGTVYQAAEALPGVPDALRRLRGSGLPLRYVTNATRQPRSAMQEQLAAMDIECEAGDILSAPRATALWLRDHGFEKLQLLVPRATWVDFEDMDDWTFELDSEQPEAVVVGDLGPEWSYDLLNRAFRSLIAGARLVAISRNRYWQDEEGLVLDAGPFVAALENAAGVEARVVGKPSFDFYEAALRDLGVPVQNVCMVGDDLEGDVRGARNVGLLAIAVRTGKYRARDEHVIAAHADAVLDSLADLPTWLQEAGLE